MGKFNEIEIKDNIIDEKDLIQNTTDNLKLSNTNNIENSEDIRKKMFFKRIISNKKHEKEREGNETELSDGTKKTNTFDRTRSNKKTLIIPATLALSAFLTFSCVNNSYVKNELEKKAEVEVKLPPKSETFEEPKEIVPTIKDEARTAEVLEPAPAVELKTIPIVEEIKPTEEIQSTEEIRPKEEVKKTEKIKPKEELIPVDTTQTEKAPADKAAAEKAAAEKSIVTTVITPELMKRLKDYPYYVNNAEPSYGFETLQNNHSERLVEIYNDCLKLIPSCIESNDKFITNKNLIYIESKGCVVILGVLQTKLNNGTITERDTMLVFSYVSPTEMIYFDYNYLGDEITIQSN